MIYDGYPDNDNDTALKLIIVAIVIALGIFWYGISQEMTPTQITQSKKLISVYDGLNAKIDQSENALKKSELYKKLQNIYTVKKLDDNFKQARHYTSVYSTNKKQLEQMLKDNPLWAVDDAEQLIKLLTNEINTINDFIVTPKKELIKIKKLIDDLIQTGGTATKYKKMEASYLELTQLVKSFGDKYKNKKSKLIKKLEKYKKSRARLKELNNLLMIEIDKKYNMDYLKFEKLYEEFSRILSEVNKSLAYDKTDIQALDTSYSKILTDMKATYRIEFGWSTWDDYAELDDTKNGTAWRNVTEDDYYKIIEADDLVARCTSGWSGPSCKKYVEANLKNYLKMRPPGGETTIEYWVSNVDANFYQKFIIEKNGKTTETDWVSVSEEEYWNNINNIGMSVAAKPIGSLNSETIKHPTPPGLAYVGNSNYGQYDSHGNWTFIPLFFGNYGSYNYDRYDYDDYNRYERNRRTHSSGSGYYGCNKSFGTFGKRTYSKGSKFVAPTNRFKKAAFSKSGSKGLSRTSRSFASKGRGRGAGGGGK